ncbi:MAG: hypothetical protein E4H10_09455 [Bacteroidia bacterium]|nr:MAG: hypothetical protein E4H10_09455 [Bacteroidia bacterium]
MWNRLGKLLQIAQGDRLMIAALLLQAFCTGIFAGSLELGVTTMFLENVGTGGLPLAFMLSGAAGVLIAIAYSYFSRQLRIYVYGILNLVMVVGLTGLLVVGFVLWNGATEDLSEFVHYTVFAFAFPLVLITLHGFWTTVRGFLTPSRGKQLTGIIELALIGGMLLAFLSTPVLVGPDFGIHFMLFIGLGSLVIASGSQLYVLSGHGSRRGPFISRVHTSGPYKLFSHRYTALMASFVVMGVMVAVLLHYVFLSETGSRFNGGNELAEFLGYFFAIAVFLGWMLKRVLFGWFKRTFGISMTLLLSPVILLLLMILSAIAGESCFNNGGTQQCIYFFLLIVFSALANRSLKDSMENPSMSLVYQSLDPRERFNVQTGIEGILSQVGVFFVGLFLLGFVRISFEEPFQVTFILFVLLIGWFFVGRALYQGYQRLLKVTLESDRIHDPVDLSLKEFLQFDLEKTAFPTELLEFNPYYFLNNSREKLMLLFSHKRPEIREMAWDHFLRSSPGLPEVTIRQLLVSEKEARIKEKIRELSKRKLKTKPNLQEAFIRERLNMFSKVSKEPEDTIGDAFQSGNPHEIFAALYLVAEQHDSSHLNDVLDLIGDENPQIQSAAICTAGLIELGNNGVKIINILDHPGLYLVAWSAIVHQGKKILEELETAFYKTDVSLVMQKRIVSAISAIGGDRAVQFLLHTLEYQNREVFQAVVYGLSENQFQAAKIQEVIIQNAILRMVNAGSWILAAKISVRADDPGGYIARVLDHESWEVNELILMLRAMIYDKRSVHRIRISLLDRQSNDRGMAIELLELLLNQPLKPVLVAYFHDVSVREKIDKLKVYYPVDVFPVDILLKRILNRNGSQLGDFIRICALERMGSVDRFFDKQQIIAQGFHPNPRIRAIAAHLLQKNDPEQFLLVSGRLDFPSHISPINDEMVNWHLKTTMKLSTWKLFQKVGINSLFSLVTISRPFSEKSAVDENSVILVRSVSAEGFPVLSDGIAIIASHQPEILEQIRYLGTIGACEAFLVDRKEFVELLFDDRALLHVFCSFLNQAHLQPV